VGHIFLWGNIYEFAIVKLKELPQICANIRQFMSKYSAPSAQRQGDLTHIHIVAHRGQIVLKHYTHASHILYILDYGPMQVLTMFYDLRSTLHLPAGHNTASRSSTDNYEIVSLTINKTQGWQIFILLQRTV
jgi:hypothetical protein